jgi:hypothetical protein
MTTLFCSVSAIVVLLCYTRGIFNKQVPTRDVSIGRQCGDRMNLTADFGPGATLVDFPTCDLSSAFFNILKGGRRTVLEIDNIAPLLDDNREQQKKNSRPTVDVNSVASGVLTIYTRTGSSKQEIRFNAHGALANSPPCGKVGNDDLYQLICSASSRNTGTNTHSNTLFDTNTILVSSMLTANRVQTLGGVFGATSNFTGEEGLMKYQNEVVCLTKALLYDCVLTPLCLLIELCWPHANCDPDLLQRFQSVSGALFTTSKISSSVCVIALVAKQMMKIPKFAPTFSNFLKNSQSVSPSTITACLLSGLTGPGATITHKTGLITLLTLATLFVICQILSTRLSGSLSNTCRQIFCAASTLQTMLQKRFCVSQLQSSIQSCSRMNASLSEYQLQNGQISSSSALETRQWSQLTLAPLSVLTAALSPRPCDAFSQESLQAIQEAVSSCDCLMKFTQKTWSVVTVHSLPKCVVRWAVERSGLVQPTESSTFCSLRTSELQPTDLVQALLSVLRTQPQCQWSSKAMMVWSEEVVSQIDSSQASGSCKMEHHSLNPFFTQAQHSLLSAESCNAAVAEISPTQQSISQNVSSAQHTPQAGGGAVASQSCEPKQCLGTTCIRANLSRLLCAMRCSAELLEWTQGMSGAQAASMNSNCESSMSLEQVTGVLQNRLLAAGISFQDTLRFQSNLNASLNYTCQAGAAATKQTCRICQNLQSTTQMDLKQSGAHSHSQSTGLVDPVTMQQRSSLTMPNTEMLRPSEFNQGPRQSGSRAKQRRRLSTQESTDPESGENTTSGSTKVQKR